MNMKHIIGGWLAAVIFCVAPASAQTPDYTGFRVCAKCHFDQGDAWRTTSHAKAFESLKPDVKASAKTKAGLDPAKDYTADLNCVGCHVTGYGEKGGYSPGMDPEDAKVVTGVSCEACHGAGGSYRQKHADGGDKLKSSGDTTDRQVLVDARQNRPTPPSRRQSMRGICSVSRRRCARRATRTRFTCITSCAECSRAGRFRRSGLSFNRTRRNPSNEVVTALLPRRTRQHKNEFTRTEQP
ncbi:MAG: cytochrome c family protein [Sulfuritalea sp.]|nr:cytochrome c family protein [Sulfuritalea sp.]